MWQISNEIVKLAKRFNANIAIERLRHPRKRKGEWSKKSARKVNRISYGFFRHALKHVAEREGVVVKGSNRTIQAKHAHTVGMSAKRTGRATTTSDASNAVMKLTETESPAATLPRGRALLFAVPKPSILSGMPQSTGTLGKMKGV